MQILFLLVGVGLGAYFSWLFSRCYYEKAKSDSNEIITRLSLLIGSRAVAQIKESITDEKKANEVLKKIWSFLSEKYGEEFMKFRCEFCSSSNIQVGFTLSGMEK